MRSLILTLLLSCCAYGQIEYYELAFWQVSNPGDFEIDPTYQFVRGKDFTVAWEDGTDEGVDIGNPPGLIAVDSMISIQVPNDPAYWVGDTLFRDVITRDLYKGVWMASVRAWGSGEHSWWANPVFFRVNARPHRIIHMRIRP